MNENENNNIEYSNFEQSNKKDDIYTHEEKDKIRPYRKYQILITILLISFVLLIYLIYSLNSELTFLAKKNNNLNQQNYKIIQRIKHAKILSDIIEVNYKTFYNLDKLPNIEIIKTLSEFYILNNFIKDEQQQKEEKKYYDIHYLMCYKASVNGDNASSFRDLCEFLSPLIFLIETTDGFRFGAYTSSFLDNKRNSFINDPYSFIFSFDTKKKYKVIKSEEAVFDVKDNFPTFGVNDIVIKGGFLSNKNSFSEFPHHYEKDKKALGDYQLTGGMKFFQIKEMEILVPIIDFR